jgi:hypothetical protein
LYYTNLIQINKIKGTINMDYMKIDRLNEDHDNQLPAELLNMTVGEMLNKVGDLDTDGNAEYEVIEDALKAINDKVLGTGYSNDEVNFTPDAGVEVADDPTQIISDEEEVPTFDQVADGNQSQNQGGLDFEF